MKNRHDKNTEDISTEKYLFQGQLYDDVPKLDSSQPYTEIVVKANKGKQTISIQDRWNGEDIFKLLSFKLSIPLDKVKIIHKGKVMTRDNVQSNISRKAVFQVIGEQAANEDGLNKYDIELMMKQLNVGRNEAVLALRKSGDVIDAMLQLGGKS